MNKVKIPTAKESIALSEASLDKILEQCNARIVTSIASATQKGQNKASTIVDELVLDPIVRNLKELEYLVEIKKTKDNYGFITIVLEITW